MIQLSSRDLASMLLAAARTMGTLVDLGGKGSGNFGHAGRPGERGGSAEGDGPEDQKPTERVRTIAEIMADNRPAYVDAYENDDERPRAKVSMKQERLSAKEKSILKRWTGDPDGADDLGDTEEINNYLRKGKEASSEVKETIRGLEKLISKGTTTRDTVLYRGMDGRVVSKLKEGSELVDKGFTALTSIEDVAHGFTGDFTRSEGKVFEVHVPKGTNILDVSRALGIKKGDSFEDEGEHLLSPGSRFQVVSTKGERGVLKLLPPSKKSSRR